MVERGLGKVRMFHLPTSLALEKSGSPRKIVSQVLRITLGLVTRASFSPGVADSWLILQLMQSMQSILWLQEGEIEDFHVPGDCGFGGDLRERYRLCRPDITHLRKPVAHSPEVGVKWDRRILPWQLPWPGPGSEEYGTYSYTKTSWTMGSPLSTQVEMWSADMSNSVGHQRLMQKHNLPTEKEFTSLFSRCWQSLKWIALFPHLCHEGHKHMRERGERCKKNRSCPFVSFTNPTQKAVPTWDGTKIIRASLGSQSLDWDWGIISEQACFLSMPLKAYLDHCYWLPGILHWASSVGQSKCPSK